MHPHSLAAAREALEKACRAVAESARRTAERILNERADDYTREPWQLDLIEPGLSARDPADRLRRILTLQRIEAVAPARSGGLVNTLKINLRAAEIATRRQHHALMSAMAERRAGLMGETLARAKDAQDEMAAIISAKGEQA